MSKLSEYIGNDKAAPEGLRIMARGFHESGNNWIAGLIEAIAEDMDGKKAEPFVPETTERKRIFAMEARRLSEAIEWIRP